MGSPIVTPDPSQQPITAADPRVAQILALIQAKSNAPPPQTTSAPDLPTSIPQVQAAPTPSMPGMTSLAAQVNPPSPGPPPPDVSLPQSPAPQLPPSPQPNVTQASPPSQPGPVKSFLMSLGAHLAQGVHGASDALAVQAGLPTAYEKQQNALKIGLQQQQQNSLEGLRQSQQDLYSGKLDQLQTQLTPTQIPNDPKYQSFAGMTLPQTAATAIMQKMEALDNAKQIAAGKNATTISGKQIQFGPSSYLRRTIQSIGGRMVSVDKGDPGNPDLQVDLGPATPMITGPANALARAKANAQYGLVPSVDSSGSPTSISRLQALQTGAPQVNFTNAKNTISDLVGVKQYQDILDQKISPNLSALNDPAQRIAIAHTLSEADKNPGMLQALITSGLQSAALTPQGAALAAGIMQGREFGGVARKYGGNMNGTEGLMNRIMANQASPLNSNELNTDLIQNDRAFTDRALQSIITLRGNAAATRPGGGGAPSPPPISTSARPSGVPANAQYITDPTTGKKGWAW